MSATLRGLEGKNVLITGAAKGQGFNHAKAFADAGADIAALDITEPITDIYPLATAQMLESAVAAIEERDRRAVPLPCDVRDEGQVEAAVAKALEMQNITDAVLFLASDNADQISGQVLRLDAGQGAKCPRAAPGDRRARARRARPHRGRGRHGGPGAGCVRGRHAVLPG